MVELSQPGLRESLRIGCAAGFWGDTNSAAAQLVRAGRVDYVVFDYLAEVTMAILSRARARDVRLGYATDFVEVVRELGPELKERGVKIVCNAGGVNPLACRDALEAVLSELGVALRVAAVTGDDLMPLAAELRREGVREMFSGAEFPEKPWSVNAYLGARPIAQALALGADIVVTGRVADSALVLGPLLHEFGWSDADYQRLAQGSLAGHVIECGAQATGGIVTDYESVSGWDDMGFPIVEVARDASFVVEKPPATGGSVSVAGVAEQIVYEIGDPRAYLLPDVVVDLSQVRLQQLGPDRVSVTGARGEPPTPSYKVSVTFADGFRATALLMIVGPRAGDKARRVAEAILARCRRLFAERGFVDFERASFQLLGAEDAYGPERRQATAREVVLRIAVHHSERAALELFSREVAPAATAMAQGTAGLLRGRPEVQPLLRLHSCLVDKSRVPATVVLGEAEHVVLAAPGRPRSEPPVEPARPEQDAGDAPLSVPLIAIAHGRSGDKGDSVNIGVIARRPEFVPLLRQALTAARVRDYFKHFVAGEVRRYELPGLSAFNFVLDRALDGGGTASLRADPQGKGYAQMLMDLVLEVPRSWRDEGWLPWKPTGES